MADETGEEPEGEPVDDAGVFISEMDQMIYDFVVDVVEGDYE